MAEQLLGDPPLTSPLFPELDVKEQLRFGKRKTFIIASTAVWARWLSALTFFVRPIVVTATLNFPNTVAQTGSDLTVSVPGADPTKHFAEVVPPPASVLANSLYWAFVSANSVVTVRFCNFSAGPLNPDSGDFRIILRHSL